MSLDEARDARRTRSRERKRDENEETRRLIARLRERWDEALADGERFRQEARAARDLVRKLRAERDEARDEVRRLRTERDGGSDSGES